MNTKEKSNLNVDVSGLKSALVNFIVPLICIGATIIIGLLFLLPSVKNKPILLEELEQSQTLNSQLQKKKVVLQDLVDFRNIVEENAQLMDSTLVSEASVPELLAQVSIIAQEAGFEVTRLSYSYNDSGSSITSGTAPSVGVSGYSEVTVSLGVRGAYDQLTAFLGSIENAARLVTVQNYRFSRDKDGILEVSFTLSSPYLFVQSSAVTDDSITLDMSSPEFVSMLSKIKALRVYKVTPEDISQLVVEETPSEIEGEEGDVVPPSEELEGGGTPFDFQELP